MGLKIKMKSPKEIEEMLIKEALKLVKKDQARNKDGNKDTVEKPTG